MERRFSHTPTLRAGEGNDLPKSSKAKFRERGREREEGQGMNSCRIRKDMMQKLHVKDGGHQDQRHED